MTSLFLNVIQYFDFLKMYLLISLKLRVASSIYGCYSKYMSLGCTTLKYELYIHTIHIKNHIIFKIYRNPCF